MKKHPEFHVRPVINTLLSILLAACGGGGDSGTATPAPVVGGASADNTTPAPSPAPAPSPGAGSTPAPSPSPAPTPAPAPSPAPSPAPAPFSATVTKAPADQAIVIGIVHLEVRGVGLGNVELLPGSGYSPVYATLSISADKTVASADVDIRALPDGPISVRISAFDLPAGSSGAREIVAMAPRTWTINNRPAHSIFFPSQTCLDFIAKTDAGLPPPDSSSQIEYNGTQSLTYGWNNGFARTFTWQTGQIECTLTSESGTPP